MSSELYLLSDEELVRLMSEDNETAFTTLYHRYWELLLGLAFNRLKDLAAAEDIVHDVFVSIWGNRRHLQAESLKSYLAAAVKYMTIASFRRKEYGHRYQEAQGSVLPHEIGMENQMHYRHILNLVYEEVNNLPEKCRVVFKFSRQNGLSTREIARVLNISPKTVDNQLHKAITHLRVRMKHILQFFF